MSMMDHLGSFLTRFSNQNKFSAAIFHTPQSYEFISHRAILARTGIKYYQESLDELLKMTVGIQGKGREQVVTVAAAIRDTGDSGMELDGDLMSIEDDEDEDAGDEDDGDDGED